MNYILSAIISSIIAGSSLLIASLGEVFSERSGVLNLGIEGIFVLGCAVSYTVTIAYNNLIVGFIIATLVGLLMGLIHGIASVLLRGNQVISGLALTIFSYGLASLIGRIYLGRPLPTYLISERFWILVLIAEIIIVIFSWYTLFKLKIGAIIRAVGENPSAADALGVDVIKTRIYATALGSSLVGLAGAWHVLAYLHMWIEGTGMGRGWIALAIVIVAGWNPILIPFFSYLFGGIDALIYSLQLPPYNMNPYLLSMIPYGLTIGLLSIFMATPLKKLFKPPNALCKAFYREERTI